MVGKTIQGRTYSGIKFKIYSTILLYSKEGQISMIDTRLQEVKPVYDKKQDTITINQRSNQKAQGCKIFQ